MLHADLDRLAKTENGLAVIWHKPFDHGLHTLCKPATAWVLDPRCVNHCLVTGSLSATTAEDYLDVSLEGITRGMTVAMDVTHYASILGSLNQKVPGHNSAEHR